MADYIGYILGTQNIAFGSLNGRTISASITLGDATAASAGVVLVQGAEAVTLGALTSTSAGTVAEFVPSRERTKRVPSWPRVLLAENPDRVIELYRPPRTVRTAA